MIRISFLFRFLLPFSSPFVVDEVTPTDGHKLPLLMSSKCCDKKFWLPFIGLWNLPVVVEAASWNDAFIVDDLSLSINESDVAAISIPSLLMKADLLGLAEFIVVRLVARVFDEMIGKWAMLSL